MAGTPTLKLSHVGPHPRAGLRFQTTFCRLVGSFAVVGPSERPKDPALVPAADICTERAPQTSAATFLERAAYRSGREIQSSGKHIIQYTIYRAAFCTLATLELLPA